MKFLKAITAFISIWVIFAGVVNYYAESVYTLHYLVAGGLMLAFAYDAFRKPFFFIVPICAIFGAFTIGPGGKGEGALFGILLGTAISDRCVKYYYKKKSQS